MQCHLDLTIALSMSDLVFIRVGVVIPSEIGGS